MTARREGIHLDLTEQKKLRARRKKDLMNANESPDQRAAARRRHCAANDSHHSKCVVSTRPADEGRGDGDD